MFDTLLEAVTGAGKIVANHFGKIGFRYKTPGVLGSVQTQADTDAEKYIIETIRKKYPTHSILTEEGGSVENDSEYTWIIDPMDGTQDFVLGMHEFGSAIALAHHDKIIASAVFFPLMNELYAAQLGKGATLNSIPIHVSSTKELDKCATIGMGRGKSERRYDFDPMIVRNSRFVRVFSATFQACRVADGRFDGCACMLHEPWDVAAASLIITEAGGIVTNHEGGMFDWRSGEMLASNGLIHDKMRMYIHKIK